ncbi:MAG: hypothetical protein Q4G40_00040 [Brachybacterium sp.]|nr:hypothetical protein [Brachybacterium sp.]
MSSIPADGVPADDEVLVGGDERSQRFGPTLVDLVVVTLISVPIQLLATDLSLAAVLIGLSALYAVCVVGLALTKFLPFYLPSVAWISLVGIAMTLPFLPWGQWFTGLVEGIDFLGLAVPALAYAGFAVSRLELDIMKRSGWKILIIAILVFFGTYFGSVVIADFTLRLGSGG